MMGYGDFSHALFFGHHLKASIIKGLSLKTPQKRLILVNTSLSTPPRPPIAPYRHVKPLDRQTYHRHHRQAHSANGERIADFSEQYEHGKTEHHDSHQASNNNALAKSEQRIEHLTAYGSLQKRSS